MSGTQEVTLNDVLSAVSGVSDKVEAVNRKVDSLGRRVDVLEASSKAKPRGRSTAAPAPAPAPVTSAPTPAPTPIPDSDPDGWVKEIRTSRCNRVTVGKTRSGEQSKLLLHMPGQRRPATFIGWDGDQEIVDFFADVLPWLSLEHFTGEELSYDVNFMVDWFITKPNAAGKTFCNAEGVYPIYEEA